MNELIESLIEKWLDFSLEVREKKGVNESLYEELIELLCEIKAALDGKDAVPKALAEIFVDMYAAVANCAELYEDEMQQRVYEAASRLCDRARDICTD